MILVLGTTNAGKQQELTALLQPFHIECQSLADFTSAVRVNETGTTFADNAALKAVQQARALNHWVLAEDSGLVVEALDGAPGVYSARFAGPEASDDENNALLIEEKLIEMKQLVSSHYDVDMKLADYLVFEDCISNNAYTANKSNINILYKDGSLKDIAEASDQLNISALSKVVTKHFVCYPKECKL